MRSPLLTLAAVTATALTFPVALAHELETRRTPPAPPPGERPVGAAVIEPAPADTLSNASGAESELRAPRVEAALEALGRHVRARSHPDALRLALQAYYNFRAAHPGQVRKPYLYFVDYGLDSRTPRGYVFDMQALEVVDGPFTVAHGRGSARGPAGVPTIFSNRKDSAASSLGLYLAQETYAFRGRSGGRPYRSIGLRLRGLSGRFNDAARTRGVVVHGAPYVTPRQAGRSEGCPAMEEVRAQRLLPKLAGGGLVFLFSPQDARWMREDPWLRSDLRRLAAADQ